MNLLEILFKNKTDSFYFQKYGQQLIQNTSQSFLKKYDLNQIICIINAHETKVGKMGLAFSFASIYFNTIDQEQITLKLSEIKKVGVGKNAIDGKSLRINYKWEIDLTHAAHGTLTAILQSFKDMGAPSQVQTPTDEKTQMIDLASLQDLADDSAQIIEKIANKERIRNTQREKLEKEKKLQESQKKLKAQQRKNLKEKRQQARKTKAPSETKFFKLMAFVFFLIMALYLGYKYRYTLLSNDFIDLYPLPPSFKATAQDEATVIELREKIKAKIKLKESEGAAEK